LVAEAQFPASPSVGVGQFSVGLLAKSISNTSAEIVGIDTEFVYREFGVYPQILHNPLLPQYV